jgi:hypothetical protein
MTHDKNRKCGVNRPSFRRPGNQGESMRRTLPVSILVVCGLLSISRCWAEVTATQVLTVKANNVGIFAFSMNVDSFDFGNVDANGTDFGTSNVTAGGRNETNTGGVYGNTSGSITWTCLSAPSGRFGIAIVSVESDHQAGAMPSDRLLVRIPAAAGGSTTGYQNFTSRSGLITGMSVGNGAQQAKGNLDLRLNVLDADPTGPGTWVIRLQVYGL